MWTGLVEGLGELPAKLTDTELQAARTAIKGLIGEIRVARDGMGRRNISQSLGDGSRSIASVTDDTGSGVAGWRAGQSLCSGDAAWPDSSVTPTTKMALHRQTERRVVMVLATVPDCRAIG